MFDEQANNNQNNIENEEENFITKERKIISEKNIKKIIEIKRLIIIT